MWSSNRQGAVGFQQSREHCRCFGQLDLSTAVLVPPVSSAADGSVATAVSAGPVAVCVLYWRTGSTLDVVNPHCEAFLHAVASVASACFSSLAGVAAVDEQAVLRVRHSGVSL